jgi:hypothetical protein
VILPAVWLPEAERELRDAISWYSDIRPELGVRFASAVHETMEAVPGKKIAMLLLVQSALVKFGYEVPSYPN